MHLEIEQINTFYGLSHILFGVSLQVARGECVALMGRNGAGKTTTLRSIMGLTPPKSGRIVFDGQPIHGQRAHQISRLGIGFVPEERAIFPDLSVWENLDVARKANLQGEMRWTVERVYEFFPRLAERRHQLGGTLSGGEQQMLTIARTLMGNPSLLLLDEPSEGLAPLIVDLIGRLIKDIQHEGMTILLAEQNTHFALKLASRVYLIDDGRIQYSASTPDIQANPDILRQYMSVHDSP